MSAEHLHNPITHTRIEEARVLTVPQAAKVAKVSRQEMYRRIDAGLPHLVYQGRMYIEAAMLHKPQ